MKFLLSVLMFLMVTVSLYSDQNSVNLAEPDVYPKKIIFGTYPDSKKSNAKAELNTFRKDIIYKKLYDLAIKNNFMIHYRPLAEYTVLAIEPIYKREVFFQALSLIRQRYPRAYHLSAEGLELAIKKPLAPLAQANSATATAPTMDTTSQTIGKPIFKVEEVSDEEMSVNSVTTTKKEVKNKSEAKAENIVASNDVKKEDSLIVKPAEKNDGENSELEFQALETSSKAVFDDMNESALDKAALNELAIEEAAVLDEEKKKSELNNENQQPKTIKQQPTTEKKTVKAVKKESSIFTFSNFLIILLLIFSPFLYKKFKKLKSIYNKY